MIKGNHTIKIGGQYQDAYTKSRRDRARSDAIVLLSRQLLTRPLTAHEETWMTKSTLSPRSTNSYWEFPKLADVRSASPIGTSSKNR